MRQSPESVEGILRRANVSQALKWTEVCLWAVGSVALGYFGYIEAKAWIAQTNGNREFGGFPSIAPAGFVVASPRMPAGGAVGRLEIPCLGMSIIVFEGTDENVLDLGAGHWSESPLPWQGGNVMIAAHRDTFFRGLRNIRKHDGVSVVTTYGIRRYEVESTRVVNAGETGVMASTAHPVLTLITCYPFR
jgi:sortase A